MNQEQLIEAWYNAHQAKIAATESEKSLRLEVAEEVFGYDPEELPKGAHYHPLPHGFRAKISFKINESLEQDQVARVIEELQELNVPAEIIQQLFKPKWSLVKAIYNTLTPSAKELVDLITLKSSAMPTLEIVSPKGAKGRR